MSWTQVQAKYVSATGSATTANSRLRGLTVVGVNGAVGRLTMRDGSPTGAVKFDQDIPANAPLVAIYIPDAGIRFENGIHVSCPTSVTLNLLYDGGP